MADNTLIQHDEGFIILFIALAAGLAGIGALRGERGGLGLMLLGLVAVVGAFALGNSDLLEIRSVSPSSLFGESETERASPGVGIYALGVGGLLTLAGGWLTPSAPRDN